MRERVEKIKNYLRENKVTYFATAGGVVIGGLSALAFGPNTEIKQTVDSWKFTIFTWKPSTINNISATLIRRGHPGFAVICKETKEQWASINQAAAAIGTSATSLANHLKGKNVDVYGLHYEILGEMPNLVSQ